MRRMKTKILELMTVLFLVLLICPAMTAKADDNEYWISKRNFKETVYMPIGNQKKDGICMHLNLPANSKNYKVSVNNKKLLKAKMQYGVLVLYPKKTGTVKVTVTAVSNGKKVKSKGTIKLVKYENPFKTLKIGGKSYRKKITMRCIHDGFNIANKTSMKINYKLKSGWKFVSKDVAIEDEEGNVKSWNIKNGKTYTWPKGNDMQVYMILKNKKHGGLVYVNLEFYHTEDFETATVKTQYRYCDKITTTSTSSSLSGWTLYDTTTEWGSWGNWSAWSATAQTASDSKQVETRKEYRYYCFYCPVCGGREPLQGASDCKKYTLSASNWQEKWFPIAYSSSNSSTYSYATYKRYTTSLGDGLRWNFSSGNLNSTAVGTIDSDSSAVVIRNAYRYRTRTKNTIYHFYKWGNWSAWSDTKYTPTANRKVETRTVTVK
ncbi:MAG: hypothetical protein ACI4S2_13560 [Lachnospiraceae bacterium]